MWKKKEDTDFYKSREVSSSLEVYNYILHMYLEVKYMRFWNSSLRNLYKLENLILSIHWEVERRDF